MIIALLVIVGYVFGSVPFSYLISRHYGVDIRQVGTHSASPGNVWHSVGPVAGAVSIAAEVAKGGVPMLLARALTGDDLAVLLVGLAAMAGHNWPLFLGFDGGRGASLGLITLLLVSYHWLGLALLPLSVLTIGLRDSAPAIFVTFLLVPVFGAVLGFPPAVVTASVGIPVITLLRRITAPGSAESTPGKRWHLLGNRLVFDRAERHRHRPFGWTGKQ